MSDQRMKNILYPLQDFTLDFYMRQTWKDPRLAFEDSNVDGNKIGSLTVSIIPSIEKRVPSGGCRLPR